MSSTLIQRPINQHSQKSEIVLVTFKHYAIYNNLIPTEIPESRHNLDIKHLVL